MNKKLASSRVLTSEELRVIALAAAARRGAPVAHRRIAWRWSAWLVWRWLLPVIGLTTVLAVLFAIATFKWLGPAKVVDTAHTWLARHTDVPKAIAVPGRFGDNADNHSSNVENFNAVPTDIPKLQIDHNYSSRVQSNATTSTISELAPTPDVSKPSSSPNRQELKNDPNR